MCKIFKRKLFFVLNFINKHNDLLRIIFCNVFDKVILRYFSKTKFLIFFKFWVIVRFSIKKGGKTSFLFGFRLLLFIS